jgi:WD40 repeat protein
VQSGKLLRTFEGHTDMIRALAVAGDILFTGSKDKTAKAWGVKVGSQRGGG